MPTTLEFIIDNKKGSITVWKGFGDRATKKEMRIGCPYLIKFNPEYENSIDIILNTGKKHDDVIMNSFKRLFDANITLNYPEITTRTHYSRKENNNVAEIYVPKEYDVKIIR